MKGLVFRHCWARPVSLRRGGILPVLMLAVLAFGLTFSPPALAEDWGQFQKDALRTGQTSDSAPALGAAKAWKVFTASAGCSGIDTTPVIADGKAFVLTIAGKVFAFDAASGAPLWSRDLGTLAPFTFEVATPACAEEKLFVAQQDGRIWALDAGTGAILWGPVTLGAPADQLNTPVTYDSGHIYVGSAFGSKAYYCLEAATGELVWARPGTHGAGYYWAGACAIGDYLVFGDDDAVLTCVNKDTGALVDEEDLKAVESGAGSIRSSVSYNSGTGRVYLTDQGGYCWAYAFNESTGDLAYQWHTFIGWSTSTPVVHDGKVYVGFGGYAGAGGLHCLSVTDGALLWTFPSPHGGGVQSSPAISLADGTARIYVTVNGPNGGVYALDENGGLLWEYVSEEAGGMAGYVLQGVALSDGRVYFGNDGGYLYALKEVVPAWDVNGDGVTNYLDMILVGNHYGESGSPGWIPADVNEDGTINYLDMILVGNHYGE